MSRFFNLRGITVPYYGTPEEFFEEALDYEPRDDDVIIASYPRTGTIFLSFIVQQILTQGESFPDYNDMNFKVIPFSFLVGTAGLDAISSKPRTYKHHFPLNLTKYNPNSKIIYIYRRPEDNVVSRYNYYRHLDLLKCDIDEYFENYLKGEVTYGCYFDHIFSYWKLRGSENMLFISYEKLHVNKKEEILRIAKFLGDKYFDALVKDESILSNIIRNTDFERMKRNLSFTFDLSDGPFHDKEVNHLRKGKVGEGKITLSEDQRHRLRGRASDKLKGTVLLSEWYTRDE